MKGTTTILITMLAFAPQAARAQSDTPPVSQRPNARIEAAMTAAARANIPLSLLESKVAEGEAKSVPQERIATAVEARLSALLRASSALEQGNVESRDAATLSVSADAIQAGVDQQVLIRVMRTSPSDQRVVATALVTQLVQLGSESGQAFTRVSTALSAGVDAIANLQAEVAAALRIRGLVPLVPLDIDATAGLTGAIGIGR